MGFSFGARDALTRTGIEKSGNSIGKLQLITVRTTITIMKNPGVVLPYCNYNQESGVLHLKLI